MNGWFVTNHFLKSDSFITLSNLIMSAASKVGVNLVEYTNVHLTGLLGSDPHKYINELKHGRPDFVLFWDKDIRLAELLEACGLKVINSASAIEACDDKSLTYIKLLNSGIEMPPTIIAPNWFNGPFWGFPGFVEKLESELGYPFIVKECFGSFGYQVKLIQCQNELFKTMEEIGSRPLIFQKCVHTSVGRDIRIQVVGGEPVACMARNATNHDFRACITHGGIASKYTPSVAQKEMAVKACVALELDFAGVDILFGPEDRPILCEVNSNAHFSNIQKCTSVNVADCIISHIIKTTNH